MNERNLKDLINCDSTDNEKMMEAAKEKLRWYTFEASEEEFDVEVVDALVRFLREVEPEMGKDLAKKNDKTACVQKKRVIELSRGKIVAAVGISVLMFTLVSVIAGNSLGTSLAWEKSGFFKWLERDKDGQTMITSPENLGMEDGNITYYEKTADVPEQYQRYLIAAEEIEGLKDVNMEVISIEKEKTFQKVCEIFSVSDSDIIKFGVIIYENEVTFIRDSFEGLDYLHTKVEGEYELTTFFKVNGKKKEYTICFYFDNKKYFVSSSIEMKALEDIAQKYARHMLEN